MPIAMKLPSFLSRRATLLLAFTVAACGTDPTGPSASKMDLDSPLFARNSTATVVSVLERVVPLKQSITVSAIISNRGGTVVIKDAGLTLQVPANALNGAASMKFTVTALAGRAIAYEFGPHGTTFSAPLTVVQDMKNTNWNRVKNLYAIEGAYFADPRQLSADDTMAVVDEFRPTLVEVAKNKISFTVDHFSGYLVSSGRSTTR